MSKFMLFDEHIGQKIYEIEEERHIVIKTRVVAKDDNEAFQKYLDCNDTTNSCEKKSNCCDKYTENEQNAHKKAPPKRYSIELPSQISENKHENCSLEEILSNR